MDAMAEKDALTTQEQAGQEQPRAARRAQNLLSTAMDGADALTARDQAGNELLIAPGPAPKSQTDPTSGAIPIE
jgi:hypothetical protein